LSSMKGYNVVQRTNRVSNPADGKLWHTLMLPERAPGA
jgi:hypothetical protein